MDTNETGIHMGREIRVKRGNMIGTGNTSGTKDNNVTGDMSGAEG